MAKIYNSNQEYKFIHIKESELKENAQSIESDDDKERRKLAIEANKGEEYVTKKHIRLPVDKCKLLGLNPDDDITPDMVKKAYHQQIKKWHPDFFREPQAKSVADAMTKQLNEAKEEITEIFRNSKP